MTVLLLLRSSELFRRITVDGDIRVTVDGDIRVTTEQPDVPNALIYTEEDDTLAATGFIYPVGAIAYTEEDDIFAGQGEFTLGATVSPATITLAMTSDQPGAGAGVSAQGASLPIIMDTPALSVPGLSTATPESMYLGIDMDDPTVSAVDDTLSGRLYFDIDLDFGMTARLAGYGRVSPDGQKQPYRVVLLMPGGTKISTLDNAAMSGNITWDLNGAGVATFTLPINDDKISDVKVTEREVQIWRGPDLLWWGVPVRAQVQVDRVEFQCVQLEWYLSRRVVGTEETNYVLNGDFEAGTSYWLTGQFVPSEPGDSRRPDWAEQYVTDELAISGSHSYYMWSDERIEWGITAWQNFFWDVDPGEQPDGEEWSLVAWCYVPSATYQGPRIRAYNWDGDMSALGINMIRMSTTETITRFTPGVGNITYPALIETVQAPINDDTPKDKWIRFEIPLRQPVTGEPEIIQVNLFTPIGGVYWDRISIVRNERLFFNNVDQALIAKGLIEHAQDVALDKSDLRIDTDTPLTGVKRTRSYYYYNHEPISDTIDEWPQLFNGFDWNIEITPTTRTFTTYYPQRGSRKPNQALVLGKNVASVTVSIDGEQTANKVMVVADGEDNAGREEAIYVEASALADDLILEKVYNATPGSAINSLQAQAARGVKRYKNSVKIPQVTTYEASGDELIGMIVPGDIVPVRVSRGWIDLNEDYRIITISLDPYTEQMTLTLNPYANWDLVPV